MDFLTGRALAVMVATAVITSNACLAEEDPEQEKPKKDSRVDNKDDSKRGAAPTIDFLGSRNEVIDVKTEALNVSNYVTTVGLPKKDATGFHTVCRHPLYPDDTTKFGDPDNFRLQVHHAAASGSSVKVVLKVFKPDGTPRGNPIDYTLDLHEGTKFRGLFLRLVSDDDDDRASEHGPGPDDDPAQDYDPDKQTIKVALADQIHILYTDGAGKTLAMKKTQVGRPMVTDPTQYADDYDPNQRTHDIREVRLHVVVFQKVVGGTPVNAPVLSRAEVEADIARANERLAQSTLRVKIAMGAINMGPGDTGVSNPLELLDGFMSAGGIGSRRYCDANVFIEYEEDEFALVGHFTGVPPRLMDWDPNSIDVFYVWKYGIGAQGRAGCTYMPLINATGRTHDDHFVVIGAPAKGDLTLSHEIMHSLLNRPDIPHLQARGSANFRMAQPGTD